MRTQTEKAVVLAAGLVMIAGGAAQAATLDASVPFPFTVEGRTMPAGRYMVLRDDMDPSVLLIQAENGTKAAMFVLVRSAVGRDPAGDTPVLTFDKYEDHYRLAGVWESATQGQELSNTKTAAHKIPTHATHGVVKSVDDNMLVITRTGKAGGEMTFALDPATHRQGTVAVGTQVDVRYHEDGKTYVATAITAQQSKPKAVGAAAPKP
jgi:hypothetical protein